MKKQSPVQYQFQKLKTVDFDIETTEDIFSIAAISDKYMEFIILADIKFDEDTIEKYMREYYRENMYNYNKVTIEHGTSLIVGHDGTPNIEFPDPDDPETMKDFKFYVKTISQKDPDASKEIWKICENIIRARPMLAPETSLIDPSKGERINYSGWNSSHYDDPMMMLVATIAQKAARSINAPTKLYRPLSTRIIRRVSDVVINSKVWNAEDAFDELLRQEREREVTDNFFFGNSGHEWDNKILHDCKELTEDYRKQSHVEYHTDFMVVTKSADDANGTKAEATAAGLKQQMAMFGMTIDVNEDVVMTRNVIFDENPKMGQLKRELKRFLTKDEFKKLKFKQSAFDGIDASSVRKMFKAARPFLTSEEIVEAGPRGEFTYSDAIDLAIARERETMGTGLNDELRNAIAIAKERYLRSLVFYNFNDVYSTKVIRSMPDVKTTFETRENVRETFPHINAQLLVKEMDRRYGENQGYREVSTYSSCGPSETAAKIASLVCTVGEDLKIRRPQDIETIDFYFPLPDGLGGFKEQDLLDYMIKREDMRPEMQEWFSYFRGKDTRTKKDSERVFINTPNGGKKINIPYFNSDGTLSPAFYRGSTGGAHGGTSAKLLEFNELPPAKREEAIRQWITIDSFGNDSNILKYTADVRDALHDDWSSFYPVLCDKLEMYGDTYHQVIDQRLNAKRLGLDPAYVLGLKLILNSTTGAGNTHKPHALLPLDNKTLKMRLIGNLMIWGLAQRVTKAGGIVLSTNTDGIHVANLDKETSAKVTADYVRDYGLAIDPEMFDRFIYRDVSNRVEYEGSSRTIGGQLRHARQLTPTSDAVGRNVAFPIASMNAAVEYMERDEDWIRKPIDPKIVEEILYSYVDKTPMQSWYFVTKQTKALRLMKNGEMDDLKFNRLYATKDEDGFSAAYKKRLQLTKANILELDIARKNGVPTKELRKYELDTGDALPDDFIYSGINDVIEVNEAGVTYEKEIKLLQTKVAYNGMIKPGFKYKNLQTWREVESLSPKDANLDMRFYLTAALELLKPWAVTENVPELNMTKFDMLENIYEYIEKDTENKNVANATGISAVYAVYSKLDKFMERYI